MSNPTTWFITGASRGIGLEFARQLSSDPANVVIASCRSPETAGDLSALKTSRDGGEGGGQLHIIRLDISDESTIKTAAEETSLILGSNGLDYLLNNAGVNPEYDGALDFKAEIFEFVMKNNVLGPALVTRHFLPLVKRGNRKVVMNMSSGLASIGKDWGSKCCTYSISKTALNMLTYKQSKDEPDIISVLVDPGWVKTVMGGEGAVLEPAESVTPFIGFLTRVTTEQSGRFFNYKGQELPW